MSTALQPTPRTTVTRGREDAVADRDRLHDFLAAAMVAHLGVVVDDHPVVLPVAFAVDLDGPDPAGTVYVHGSVAAGWMRRAPGSTVCITVTELDGLVLARSAFNHSVNYRSSVIIGSARLVTDETERQRALDLTVDHLVPGRSAALRPSTRKELAATALLAVSLAEASMKERQGGPDDDEEDVATGAWGGMLPLRWVASPVVSSGDSHDDVPDHVLSLARSLT